MALSISQRPSIQYHSMCELAPDPCVHNTFLLFRPLQLFHIFIIFFLKFKLLFDQLCFKLFDYNSVFQYSVKWTINDFEISSTNKIDFQRKCGLW